MERQSSMLAARGLTDPSDCLLRADDPLAQLHARCGGVLPGKVAIPELLELVRQARRMGLKIAREFSAYDGQDMVSGFARIQPRDESEGGGCDVLIENWQFRPVYETDTDDRAEQLDAVDRTCAEVTARLDTQQCIQLFNATGPDTSALQEAVAQAPGSVWTDHVTLDTVGHRQPLHWRLLDGMACTFDGSQRRWRARLLPLGGKTSAPRGFELLLVADHPLSASEMAQDQDALAPAHTNLIGGSLTPVLRQPIARIIANAETVRARLAGPLRAEYSDYAGNIASAGQHLNGLLDDLADLEVVEAIDFSTQSEAVDLSDAVRRAAGILGVRAQAKKIELVLPIAQDTHVAQGEFRRVLQIFINLIGNAIAYSPESSVITVQVGSEPASNQVTALIVDQGPGISEEQASRIFDKFERLGRENDGGSGLGLYISAKLAEAMDGKLEVVNAGEQGAAFQLTLPAHSSK